ncbi:uncharacterized protein LOC114579699 [Dendrobium catenatum]|uniref:uncharacterized protein LOC114579699 n=1 Tax=Dendrobium catenatum TaxID=906689 RepID=UPI00109F6957|nr:uncharacterized protein LOC114579699 [Dendrobium catenatum]
MILLQFEITFIPLRVVKGQAVANFLAAHLLPVESPLNDDLPDEQIMSLKEPNNQVWEMYFDGAASSQRGKVHQPTIPRKVGIGLVFITPDKEMMYFSYHLSEPCTNNEAEYEALITSLELTIPMEIKEIKIFGDSQLVINQIAGTYKVLNPKLLKYHQYTSHLLEQIPIVTMYRIPRGSNSSADTLAKLAKEFSYGPYQIWNPLVPPGIRTRVFWPDHVGDVAPYGRSDQTPSDLIGRLLSLPTWLSDHAESRHVSRLRRSATVQPIIANDWFGGAGGPI